MHCLGICAMVKFNKLSTPQLPWHSMLSLKCRRFGSYMQTDGSPGFNPDFAPILHDVNQVRKIGKLNLYSVCRPHWPLSSYRQYIHIECKLL